MRKKSSKKVSVDGIVNRSQGRRIGDFERSRQQASMHSPFKEDDETHNQSVGDMSPEHVQPMDNISINDIEDEPLDDDEMYGQSVVIDETPIKKKRSRLGSWWSRRREKRRAKKEKWARRHVVLRVARRIFKTFAFAGAAIALMLGISSWNAFNNIIDRSGDSAIALQENIDPSALNGEGDGRVNIMLLGIGGDGHQGGNLADSILIVSIDPFSNEMAMLSIPRDMYVEIPGYYSTRINEAHSIGEDEAEYGGIALQRETLEEVLDINIHYYARVDFQGFVQAIDTVGGVTITLDEHVYDPNFDWEFGVNALNLPAGEHTLDGQTALLLARARGASGIGYGVARGDFGRADRQRQILLSLKDKVLSVDTYTNPLTINNLIGTAGDHARTDIQIGEMLRLHEIVSRIPAESIISFGLDNGSDNYLTSANINGAAVLLPKTGDFEEIQLFVRELFVDGFVKQEAPSIGVYNGTTVAGLASEAAFELESYGYNVGTVANAPTQDYTQTIVYDLSDGEKPYTKQLISNRFGVEMRPASELPAGIVDTTSDFIVIIGHTNETTEEAPGF